MRSVLRTGGGVCVCVESMMAMDDGRVGPVAVKIQGDQMFVRVRQRRGTDAVICPKSAHTHIRVGALHPIPRRCACVLVYVRTSSARARLLRCNSFSFKCTRRSPFELVRFVHFMRSCSWRGLTLARARARVHTHTYTHTHCIYTWFKHHHTPLVIRCVCMCVHKGDRSSVRRARDLISGIFTLWRLSRHHHRAHIRVSVRACVYVCVFLCVAQG